MNYAIAQQPNKAPAYVKADHPTIPCPSFECDRGCLTIYIKPDGPVDPINSFLRCSNYQFGCNQTTYFAYGYSKCFQCKEIIKKVVTCIIGLLIYF